MKKNVLYFELAKYYDLISSLKDYKKEAAQIKVLIAKYKKSEGRDLLDVACGTGHHLTYLKDEFHCMGVDISDQMLKVARKNVERVVFEQADMTELNLDKQFDVITCLFSAIGYVKTYAKLRRTIQSFAKHLKQGGVVLIEPWFTKSTYLDGSLHMNMYGGSDIKIAEACVSKTKRNVSVQDMHYLVAEKDKGITHFVDRHVLGLFEIDKTLVIMKSAGFRAEFLKNGLMKDRGLFVGVKQ